MNTFSIEFTSVEDKDIIWEGKSTIHTLVEGEFGFDQAHIVWNFEINECEKCCVDVGQPKDGIHIVDIVKKKKRESWIQWEH